jgi:hypothetical protein
MSFSPSLASVIAAIAGLSIGAAGAIADPIPGPPIAPPMAKSDLSASDRAGAYCPPRTGAGGNVAGFAAGVLIAAIAARRRDPRP